MFFKRPPAPPAMPELPKLDSVDISKRYDVYCHDSLSKAVVYRDVLIKGRKSLFPAGPYDFSSAFLELEHPDGQTVYVGYFSVQRFCAHGTVLPAEHGKSE